MQFSVLLLIWVQLIFHFGKQKVAFTISPLLHFGRGKWMKQKGRWRLEFKRLKMKAKKWSLSFRNTIQDSSPSKTSLRSISSLALNCHVLLEPWRYFISSSNSNTVKSIWFIFVAVVVHFFLVWFLLGVRHVTPSSAQGLVFALCSGNPMGF